MTDIAIVAAVRTPIGSFRGAFAPLSAVDLGAAVVRGLLERCQLPAAAVDELIFGQVLTAGCGQNPARQTALRAGLPVDTPAVTVNLVCGSGLKAVQQAVQAIRCGDAGIVIAGGQESMSNAPYLMHGARDGLRFGHASLQDSMIQDGLWDAFNDYHMGITAENLAAAIRILGRRHAIPVIVLVCALLTYGGVSLFVVAFAVYPFAAELFRQSGIPKRLIPATVALGAFSFTMDALPGTPQIQNIIPTSFFGTNAWAAPWLGLIGSLFIIIFGLLWLERQRRKAQARGEGYGTDLQNEPETPDDIDLPHPLIAIAPLLLVGVLNLLFTHWIPQWYGASHELTLPGLAKPVVTEVGKITAIWAVQAALLSGIVLVLVCGYRNIRGRLAEGSRTAVGGAILAAMNTASEYGFGAVIAALPGFLVLSKALAAIPNPLLNEAISVTVLAGITGSASGGMSIALAAMSETFVAAAHAANIPLEVLHRVAAMASGGMDTLPHNGAVITLLAITGLSHRQAYGGIFAITVIKSLAVLFVIATFYVTGIV